MLDFSGEPFSARMLSEVQLADHRPINSFNNLQQIDLLDGSCQGEAAARTSFAAEYIRFDQLLEYLEQVFQGDIILLRNVMRKDNPLLLILRKITDCEQCITC